MTGSVSDRYRSDCWQYWVSGVLTCELVVGRVGGMDVARIGGAELKMKVSAMCTCKNAAC